MKAKFTKVLLFTFFALLTFTSCQNEITEITQADTQQVIAPNSPLANLMVSTSINDGSVDNIMDNSDCMSINLPVTIIVNSITITINTLQDLELIEAIFEEFNDDLDELEFLFPITIVLNDYTEVVIENQNELADFIERCSNVDEPVECIDFQYPISFSIFNADFQVIDTVVIESDEDLYHFLDRLDDADGGAIIASLNFPVTMVFANGETVEINSNQELERVINDAQGMCEDNHGCDITAVDTFLTECHWNIHYYNDAENYRPFDLYFLENGELKVVSQENTIIARGNWNTSVTDAGVVLTISELSDFSEVLEGDWLIDECHENRYKLIRENAGVDNTRMVIKQHCEDEPNCSAQEVRSFLNECQWFAGSNLFDNVPAAAFNFQENHVLVATITNTGEEVAGTWNVELTDEGIILGIELPAPYDVISKRWKISECGEHRVKMISGDYYLVFERECQNNPFECFDDTELVVCDDDTINGFAQFNLEMVFPNCPQDNVEVTYHATENEAESGINSLPTVYENNTNPQVIYARVAVAGNNTNYEVFEVVLYVEDCSTSCTETQVDAYLIEANCHWVPAAINGSNDFVDYDFYFNENLDLVIVLDGAETVGTWMTTQGADGVIVSMSQISDPLQQFNGEWLVVECGAERMVLTNNNIELILERECQ
ncbi:MAG: hypothetical protein GXO84_12270 [Chlorobi bacterium]|nr:hypothetical protein [Chlorobiota bacterium]